MCIFGDNFAVILSVIWQIFAAVLAFFSREKVTYFPSRRFFGHEFSYWECELRNEIWRRGERSACQIQILIAILTIVIVCGEIARGVWSLGRVDGTCASIDKLSGARVHRIHNLTTHVDRRQFGL